MGAVDLKEEGHHKQVLFWALKNQMHLHRKMTAINCVLRALRWAKQAWKSGVQANWALDSLTPKPNRPGPNCLEIRICMHSCRETTEMKETS